MVGELQRSPGERDTALGATLRVAAVGDLHVASDSVGRVRPGFEGVAERADILLLAGDLTHHGLREEADLLAAELADLGIPIVAVLGNHDYHHGEESLIRRILEGRGVCVLEAEAAVFDIAGARVGVGGVKGFGGGFAGACASEFGEPEMKAFIRHTKDAAQRLRSALEGVHCDVRLALTHYAPVKETLMGERPEIYPFLGSYLLGEAIDHARCDLAMHGHAHRGTERGVSAVGVPVRNVARPVIKQAYRIYHVPVHKEVMPAVVSDVPDAARTW
jgi:Icc-related predicted phosphoesterase